MGFKIEDGVLEKYIEEPGVTEVVIPDGVTKIGSYAFYDCTSLSSITIPDSVTEIGDDVFFCCTSLTSITIPDSVINIGGLVFYKCTSLEMINVSSTFSHLHREDVCSTKWYNDQTDFAILGTVLITYKGNAAEVMIPDSVTVIGKSAFYGCKSLSSITIPNGVTKIEENAFNGCTSLTSVKLGKGIVSIEENAFSKIADNAEFSIPNGLPDVDDDTVKKFIVPNWQKIDPKIIADYFINKHSKPFLKLYAGFSGDRLNAVGEAIIGLFGAKPSAKICSAAADFVTMYYSSVDGSVLKAIYDAVKSSKTGEKAAAAIEAVPAAMKKMGCLSVDSKTNKADKKVLKKNSSVDGSVLKSNYEAVKSSKTGAKAAAMQKTESSSGNSKMNKVEKAVLMKASEEDVLTRFRNLYKIDAGCLPEITDTDGNELSEVVLAWLLIVNDEMKEEEKETAFGIRKVEVLAYNKPGYCADSAEIIDMIDQTTLQAALIDICDVYLGRKGNNAQHHFAYPLCRYADEETLAELIKRAPSWRSGASGINAPALREFRNACKYSTSKQAVFFAEKYEDLGQYAFIRGTDAVTIRDTVLSDVGLDADGTKKYDLGNQIVTVRMQPDYSFIVEPENGKPSKSIPKKGADEEKYNAASKDFSEMKKNVKKVVKNRFDYLFGEFLYGGDMYANSWNEIYTTNPVLKQTAMMIVWAQGNKTFTMTANGLIDSEEKTYTLSDEDVAVAHPMEMTAEDVERWQKYFTSHSLKQPFLQIWEPVRDPETIKEDRYAGVMIPFFRFTNQQKHGITVEDNDFHNEIRICFRGMQADVQRIDWARHEIHAEDRFEIKTIGYQKYTRLVNHEIAYLDKITVWDRIRSDDQTVADMLNGFTLAQIMEFISAAQESNAVSVLALLMDYKNRNFADYDPMDEFALDW